MEKLKVRGCGWGEKREEVKVRQKKRGEADGGTRKRKGKKKRREGEMMGDLPARHDLGMATI